MRFRETVGRSYCSNFMPEHSKASSGDVTSGGLPGLESGSGAGKASGAVEEEDDF